MKFRVITIFPEVFAPYLSTSILGRAQTKGLADYTIFNLRDFTDDVHKTVDDTPYGGGAGMVMKVEPIDKAVTAIRATDAAQSRGKTVVLSARGRPFTQALAADYVTLDHLTLICGRYEGVDQRVADYIADEEISIGPYVLAGGELPALVVIEAVTRLIPGVLGNPASLVEESFNSSLPHEAQAISYERSGEYPQYTKPADYKGWKVPDILLSGDHAQIKQWRSDQQTDPFTSLENNAG